MPLAVSYDGPSRLQANQLFRARIAVTPGTRIASGGRIVLATRHVSDFGDPQMDDPSAENFVRVDGPVGTAWSLGPINEWSRHPWNRGIDLILAEGWVDAAQTVTISLENYRCQSFTETFFRLRPAVDADGAGDWTVLPEDESPGFEIVGAAAAALSVTVQRPLDGLQETTVCVKAEDVYGNVAGSGVVEVSLLVDDQAPLVRVRPGATVPIRLPRDDAWHRLTAVTDDGRLFARSNPFGPSPMPGYGLYWGEIHAQSGLCDGTNRPAELYEYARTAAGLDFAAVSSHDFHLTAADWDEMREAAEDAHRPGEFVTFLGYEWSGTSGQGGDHNIYFLDDGPLVYSAPWHGHDAWRADDGAVQESLDLTEVIERLRADGRKFMIVPHGGGRTCNFDYYDSDCMPMMEIYSCHRSYEHLAQQALARELRMGFIGGSDDHRGALGDSHPAARERFFSTHNGLVAVYAEELTREALWDAFFEQRVYATNGARIVLDVRVNGRPMGGHVTLASGASVKVEVRAWLDGLLDRVELVRGTQTVETSVGPANKVPEFEVEHWEGAPAGHTPYYVRVIQTDGGAAWSSPVWVEGH